MHLRTGSYPPPGADPAACPRAIYGVYDDHDFSWNDGNGYQLAQKSLLKQVRCTTTSSCRRSTLLYT